MLARAKDFKGGPNFFKAFAVKHGMEIMRGERMNNKEYTFEMMYEDMRNGYQIYYTYVRNRYMLFRTAKNCYTQKLISTDNKNPHPKTTMITLKRVLEIFPYMEDIEYRIEN